MRDRMEPSTAVEHSDGQTSDGAIDATGVYEAGDDTVLYDSEDPLAWIQADTAVRLTEMT